MEGRVEIRGRGCRRIEVEGGVAVGDEGRGWS